MEKSVTLADHDDQPKYRVEQQNETLLKKHAVENTKFKKEHVDMKAAGNEMKNLRKRKKMKEMTGKTSGQKVEKDVENEISQSQGSETKIDEQRNQTPLLPRYVAEGGTAFLGLQM